LLGEGDGELLRGGRWSIAEGRVFRCPAEHRKLPSTSSKQKSKQQFILAISIAPLQVLYYSEARVLINNYEIYMLYMTAHIPWKCGQYKIAIFSEAGRWHLLKLQSGHRIRLVLRQAKQLESKSKKNSDFCTLNNPVA